MTSATQNLIRTAGRLLITAPLLLTGCVKGGSLTSDSTGSAGATGNLAVTKVFPTSQGDSWNPITDAGPPVKYYVKGTSLTITGTCSTGVATIKVHEASASNYSEVATCDVNGYFTWTHVYAANTDVDKALTLTAYDVADTAITGTDKSVSVHMDDGKPNAVTFTDPNTNPFLYNGVSASYIVKGNCAADVVKITYGSPTGPEATLKTATTWEHTVALTPGITNHEDYYTYDKAGNYSVMARMDIDWSPKVSIRAWAVNGGGLVYDHGGTSGPSLEGSVTAFPGTAALQPVAGGKFISLGIGFNYIVKSARGN